MDIDILLQRAVEEIIDEHHLRRALKSGRKLRVKLGIDPTKPDLHLGHTVALRKLRQFQELGHKAVLIIGDFTAMIGDPSGRSEERKPLTENEVKRNMKEYLSQAGKFIDLKKAEVYHNSKWFNEKNIFQKIAARVSIQQVLEREDFKQRMKEGVSISMLEAMYPILQGYDSVMVKADVEIGGTDQKFNLLMGRRMQRAYKIPEQDVLTVSLIEGTDGAQKMSKSSGNYIALRDTPNEIFGKVMSIPDALIDKYYITLTDSDTPRDMVPRESKLRLAKMIVYQVYGSAKAEKAEKEFINVFSKGELPGAIAKFGVSKSRMPIVDLLVETQMAKTKSDARRLVVQGGVKVNKRMMKTPVEIVDIQTGDILQVGKRKFLKLTI